MHSLVDMWHRFDFDRLTCELGQSSHDLLNQLLGNGSAGHDSHALDVGQPIVDQLAAYEHFVRENRATIHAFVSWVFSSPEPADSLRRELLALHTANVASIERALGEVLEDPCEAAELTITLVSLLHGNMLLALCGAPESGPIERGRVLNKLLDRALASVPHQRR